MSTENNLESLYKNSIKILSDLIAFKTVSGEDNNSLINYCDEILKKQGATSFKIFDSEKKRVNLFATLKAKKPNGKVPIILSGHTDVVPVSKGWASDPFKAIIKDDKLTIPHLEIENRSFVLAPITEINPNCFIPGKGKARDLLAILDQEDLEIIQ